MTCLRQSAAAPVLELITAIVVIAVAVDAAWVRPGSLHFAGSPTFWLAALAFGVGEAVVLHVELGRNAHSVSLAELTLTVALFFLPAGQLPIARILGGAIVLLVVRRQRPLKLTFNSALWLLDVAIASVVFQQLGGSLHHGTLRLVAPAVLAALAAALVDSLAVNAVIAATSREIDLPRAARFVGTCLLGALGCAVAALVCVGALAFTPWLLIPIILVLGMYLYGFQHFGTLRAQHSNVNLLYDFTGELSRTPHGEQVVRTVLRRVCDVLRAEDAVLYLQHPDGGTLQSTHLDEDGQPVEHDVRASELPALLLAAVDGTEPLVVRAGTRDPLEIDFLREYAVRDAVLAPVRSEQGLRGIIVITNRLGEVSTFGAEDGLLLQTLASHAAAALANSRLVQQLNHDSLHDSLTGLANRAMFQQCLTQALRRKGSGVGVLLMDLDRFKEVNDTLGHHHGDLLLERISHRLQKELRGSDLLARLGGDEFAVLLTDVSVDDTVATAQRLLAALNKPMSLQGVAMEVSASIGVVHRPQGRTESLLDATVLLQRADVAMYVAKKHYSGVHVYQDELDGYSPRRLALAGGLRAAIEQGQLTLRYQPQARLSDGVIIGAEALVRWEHPAYGEVQPDEFISIAEQTGQIRELTRCVLDQALADCARWAEAGAPMNVSVNLSVRNLMEPDLLTALDKVLVEHGVPARRLMLEITESHLMADPARTAEVLRAIASRGISLSIDDFGTGYSSLAYLKQLPVAEVKIDKSFVRDVADDEDDAAIVEAIIQLAHTMRLQVVAEGVEDPAAQRRLTELGCDILQGFHLARPMPAAALGPWLDARASQRAHEGPAGFSTQLSTSLP